LNFDGEKSTTHHHFTVFYRKSQQKNDDSAIGIGIACNPTRVIASKELICEGYEGLAGYNK
jgi:hypothetical protein